MTSVDECMQARIKHAHSFYLTRWLWIESKPVKLETCCTVIIPPYGECSLSDPLWQTVACEQNLIPNWTFFVAKTFTWEAFDRVHCFLFLFAKRFNFFQFDYLSFCLFCVSDILALFTSICHHRIFTGLNFHSSVSIFIHCNQCDPIWRFIGLWATF